MTVAELIQTLAEIPNQNQRVYVWGPSPIPFEVTGVADYPWEPGRVFLRPEENQD